VLRLASIRASAVAVLLSLLAACGSRDTDRPPLVVIVVDTLRADRLPAYGYTKVETPSVGALVADGRSGSRLASPTGRPAKRPAGLLGVAGEKLATPFPLPVVCCG
jgi:hypothetical protein